MTKSVNKLAVAALAGLMTIGAFSANASEEAKGENSCKADSSCKSAEAGKAGNTCKGDASCKGAKGEKAVDGVEAGKEATKNEAAVTGDAVTKEVEDKKDDHADHGDHK